MKNTKIKILLFFLFAVSLRSFSATETKNIRTGPGTLASGLQITVMDEKFQTAGWLTNNYSMSHEALVRFGLDETKHKVYPNFSAQIQLNIKGYDVNGAQAYNGTHILNLNYTTSGIYYDKSVFKVGNYAKLVVTVMNISATSIAPPPELYVEAEVKATRYYKFPSATYIPSSATAYFHYYAVTKPCNTNVNCVSELDVHWDYFIGAEEYELEWTWVNDYPGAPLTYDFRTDATRITTMNNYYRIPVLYEKGFLVIRMRGIAKKGPNVTDRIEGYWTNTGTFLDYGSVANYPANFKYQIIPGDQQTSDYMNWSSTVTFAEDGKKGAGMSYMDGLLMARQSQAKLNTEGKTIFQQTIYDYQGRPAVSVLPAPINVPYFNYKNNLSMNAASQAYGKDDFDTDAACVLNVQPMNTALSTGAANYYSPNNSNQTGAQGYVPDAKQYPFVQVEYAPDKTGNIISQSMPGDAHKIGNGHETKFFYSNPGDAELKRLFGSDAGNVGHYDKNMVVDANGQVSTTYKDMSGKVVATALMGNKPAALDAIQDYNNTEALVDDLTKFNKTDPNNYTIISSKKVFVESPNSVQTFNYEFTPQDFIDAACAPTKCFDCIYEVEFSVTDECSQEVIKTYNSVTNNLPVTAHVGAIINSGNVGNCDNPSLKFQLTPPPISITFPNIGNYKITKTLKISDAPIAQYVAEYMASGNSCVKTLQQFINEQNALIDFSSCGTTCQACSTSVTTYINNHPPNTLSPTQITKLLEDCGALCADYDPCEASRQAMLADFYPGGQYAIYATNDQASIFYNSGTSALGINYNTMAYPQAMWPLYPFPTGIAPKDPASMILSDYIKYYKKEWATLFLDYHPEKPYLDFCVANKASDQYDYAMLQVTSFDEACQKGFIKPLSSQTPAYLNACTTTTYDPFFATGGQGLISVNNLIKDAAFTDVYNNTVAGFTGRNYNYKDFMNYAFTAYPISSTPVNNTTNQSMYSLAKVQGGGTGANFGSDACSKDKEWIMFRSLYLNYKMRLVAQRKTDYVMSATIPASRTQGFNGCMLNSGLNTSASPFSPLFPSNIVNITSNVLFVPGNAPTSLNFLPFSFAPLALTTYAIHYTFMDYPITKTPNAILTGCSANSLYYNAWGQTACSGNTNGDTYQPCSSGQLGIFNNKKARFPQMAFDITSLINSYNSNSPSPNNTMPAVAQIIPTPLSAASNNACNDICTSYAEEWMFKLKDCNPSIDPNPSGLSYTYLNPDPATIGTFNLGQYNSLKADLILVCKNGCDQNNPFGSSTINPATTPVPTYQNFAQVIQAYFPSAPNANCTAELIGSPKPYGSNVSGTNSNPSKLDTCGCDKILSAKYFFLQKQANSTLPAGVTTAEQYFTYTYGNPLPNFSELECKCNTAWNSTSPPNTWYTTTQVNHVNWSAAQQTAINQSGTIWVPSFLDCAKPCVACTTVVNAINAYNVAHPTYQSSNNYSTLLTTYLNNLFDFNLGINDYMDFYNTCGNTMNSNCPQYAIATKLKALLNNWIAYYNNNPNCITNSSPFYNIAGPTGIPNLFNSVGTPDFLSCAPPTSSPINSGIIGATSNPQFNAYGAGNGVTFYNIFDASGNTCQPCELNIDILNLPVPANTPLPQVTNISFNIIANNMQVPGSPLGTYYNFSFGLDNNDYNGIGYFSCLPAVVPCYNQNMLCDKPYPSAHIVDDCVSSMINNAYNNALYLFNRQVKTVTNNFTRKYKDKCLAVTDEKFERNYNLNEYHYTLYYYDQAGNLVKTVPPKGVTTLLPAQYNTVPAHKYATNYSYQSYGAPRISQSPDETASTDYVYDKFGRIVASSNAKQKTASGGPFSSYTVYDDALGRIVEVGEVNRDLSQIQTQINANLAIKTMSGAVFTQVIRTQYDQSINATVAGYFPGSVQANLRNRVASVTYEDTDDNDINTYKHATHYSYDEHGNVKNLVQENGAIGNLGIKNFTMEYDYDLISGNVNTVSFQKGRNDQFFHKYEYDDDNRLHIVMTSKDGFVWDRDAKYFYYDHGPLARKELGEQKVHAEDFAYTIQGWVKNVNSNILDTKTDIGKDGDISNYSATVSNIHNYFGRDAFGYSLNYFGQGTYKDYQAIKNANYTTNDKNPVASIANISTGSAPFDLQQQAPDLYNGNISSMVTGFIDKDPTNTIQNDLAFPQLTAYKYDQLHRIKQMKAYRDMNFGTNAWNATAYDASYESNFTYDKNGNILTHKRMGTTPAVYAPSPPGYMDDLTYFYEANGTVNTNKLIGVNDPVNTNAYSTDIDGVSNPVIGSTGTYDYLYDNIGNLIYDKKEYIAEIKWTVDRKVAAVIRDRAAMFAAGKNLPDIFFDYDANRQRVSKIVKPIVNSSPTYPYVTENNWVTTYYVRDGSNNIMATYAKEFTPVSGNNYSYSINAKEFDIYGSGRIGNTQRALNAIVGSGNFNSSTGIYSGTTYPGLLNTPQTSVHGLAKGSYELNNHLGNVIAVISDRKLGVDVPVTNGIIDYYLADIRETHDYYPFGYDMPGRTFGSDYRLGHNGQERERSTFEGAYSALYWGYDSRLGRRWEIDPVMDDSQSPYATFENNPILFDDPDGDCPWCFALAIIEGGAELGGQLLSGKSLDEVDWADVGISAASGFVDGIPGGGAIVRGLKATVKVLAPATKALFDYSTGKGHENVFNGKKHIVDAAIDLAADVYVSRVFDKIGEKAMNPLVKKYLKQTIIKKLEADKLLKQALKKAAKPHATSKQIIRKQIQEKVAKKAAGKAITAESLNKSVVKAYGNYTANKLSDVVKTAHKDHVNEGKSNSKKDEPKEQQERPPMEQSPRF